MLWNCNFIFVNHWLCNMFSKLWTIYLPIVQSEYLTFWRLFWWPLSAETMSWVTQESVRVKSENPEANTAGVPNPMKPIPVIFSSFLQSWNSTSAKSMSWMSKSAKDKSWWQEHLTDPSRLSEYAGLSEPGGLMGASSPPPISRFSSQAGGSLCKGFLIQPHHYVPPMNFRPSCGPEMCWPLHYRWHQFG